MSHRLQQLCAGLVLICFSFNFAGCYKTVAVKPEELPKLNRTYVTTSMGMSVTGQPATTVDKSVVNLERSDGRLYQLKGVADVILYPRGGGHLYFDYPIDATVSSGTLKIKSKNYANKSFRLDKIQSTRLRVYDMEATLGLTLGITLGTFLVGGLIGLAASSS